ncbi:hypothetical protein FLA_6384 [Filimonas lacunae]|nr:hypothetical protein FLA_6384 [Filimonas lacunae]
MVYFLLVCLLSCFSVVRAQRVSAELDKDKILIGGQVTLQVKLEDFNPRLFTLQSWFNIPDTGNHIEVVRRGKIDTVLVGGYITYIQKLVITSFDSGSWKLPLLAVNVFRQGESKSTELKAPWLNLDVLTVDVSAMKEYHPVKGIVEIKILNNVWLIGVLAIMSLVSGYILWWFIRVRKRARKMAHLSRLRKRGRSPLYRATQQFTALKKAVPIPYDQIKEFYTQVDDICRIYLSEMFLEQTMQCTSEEIMVLVRKYITDEEAVEEFRVMLVMCDSVKFAKYLPSAAADDQLEFIEVAAQILQRINKLSRSRTKTKSKKKKKDADKVD